MEVDGVLREPTVSRANPPIHPIILQAPSPPLILVMAHKLTLVETVEVLVGARLMAGELQRVVRQVVRRKTLLPSSSNKIGGVHQETKNRMFGLTRATNHGEVRRARSLPHNGIHHLVTI